MKKIFFGLNIVDGYPPVAVESVWGEIVNENQFKIKNLPFYINDIALDDIVSVVVKDNQLFFSGLVKASGRGLVRVVLFEDDIKDVLIDKLETLKLNWESIKGQEIYSIDVPDLCKFNKIISFLEKKTNFLDYQETVIPE